MERGTLAGIARHAHSRGPMELLARVPVTRANGISGDVRGTIRPGKSPKRQVTVMTAEAWAEAMAELGLDLPWQVRRVNLLVSGLHLPQTPGAVIAIGESLRIEITGECDPCSRMDEIAPGLKAALLPHWRGGITGKVLDDGPIAVGDETRIEP